MKLRTKGLVRTLGVAAMLAPFALAGLAGPAAAQKNVLRVVPHADLKNLDPIWTTAYITRNHGYLIYDTLIAMDDKLMPQPQMLEGWKVSSDGLTYTLTLRDGLRWHDGAPVTAEDIVPSIKRWGKRDGMGQKLMDFTAELKAVDAKTVRLTLKEPYGLVLQSLGKISSNTPFMMPKRLAEVDAFEKVPETVGSGPFRFVKDEWVPGAKVVYVKNAEYKPRSEPASYAAGGKVVKVDRVEWVYMPDAITALNALQNGEVDYWETPTPDLRAQLKTSPGVKLVNIDPLGTQGWLRPNHLHPPFNNPKARQALLHMVKQADYLRSIAGEEEYWTECGAYFICGTPLETLIGADPLVKQDLAMAKKLLAEGGYKGETLILMDPTDIPVLHGASLVTAQLLRQIGAKVEVQAMDWSTLTSRRAMKESPGKGGWNIFHTYATAADAASPVANIGVSGGCTERAWFGWPCDEKTEQLRDAYSREADPAKQMKIVEELQSRLYKELVPYVNYGQWYQPAAFRDNLDGVLVSPVPFFWNISKK
ncbi:MAG: ABC transporter substrate-binding protein [Alphaproteobacteria bacterium]|nr:ABC transporter substrate-binding protein [Alphaproteobacteria bacterium]